MSAIEPEQHLPSRRPGPGGRGIPAIPPPLTLIDDIVGVLNTVPGYANQTYAASDGNRFIQLDTPGLWGINPNDDSYINKPSTACVRLLAAIDDVIARAERILDISIMWELMVGLPGGHFQRALSDGFRRLNASGKTPLVRILIGIPTPAQVAVGDLENWLKATIHDWQHLKYPVFIATNHTAVLTSWNHSKIVASDCKRAVVGGHNLWSDAYFGFGPVHDVSGWFEGPAVLGAHQFLNRVWGHPFKYLALESGQFHNLPNMADRIRPDLFTRAPAAGSAKMLSLGRLGDGIAPFNISSNASVTARVLAFCRAKSRIRLSQQSLIGPFQPGAYSYDFYTVLALIRAIRESGVQVEIVVSNEQGDYHGYANDVVATFTAMYIFDKLGRFDKYHVPPRSDLHGWAKLTADPPWFWDRTIASSYQDWINELNQKLFVTTLAFSDNGAYQWHSQGKTHGAINHAKVYIIDDTAFYVGSDNAYFSTTKEGLQEFGYLVENPAATQGLLDNYWNKLWKYSQVRRIPAKPLG